MFRLAWFARSWGAVDLASSVGEDIRARAPGVPGVLLSGWGCVCVVFAKLGVGRSLFSRSAMILARISLARFLAIFVLWVVNFCV